MLAPFPIVLVLVVAGLVSTPAEPPLPGALVSVVLLLGVVALPEGSDAGGIWFELFPHPASRSIAAKNGIIFFMAFHFLSLCFLVFFERVSFQPSPQSPA